jgi:hypothetical protein
MCYFRDYPRVGRDFKVNWGLRQYPPYYTLIMRQKIRVAAQWSMTGKFAGMRRLCAARRDDRGMGIWYLRFQKGGQGEGATQ